LHGELSGAIAAFQSDVEQLSVANSVIGMTFSEFGRRIRENGSGGTDHGTSSPQFLFGTNVVPGLCGPNPDFTRVDTTGDFIYNIDFRQLYATILGRWFGASEAELQTVLYRHFDQVDVVRNTLGVGEDSPVSFSLKQNYPNPFNPSTTLTYAVPEEAFVSLAVYNSLGQKVKDLYRGSRSKGTYSARFDATGLASGIYFSRMEAGPFIATKKMILAK
jgi:hypothetical protein